LMYGLYSIIEPTYEASSLIRIQPSQPELFGSTARMTEGGFQSASLETQKTLILADRVLDPAIAELADSPIIKKSPDPKTELKKKLEVRIIPNTFLIQVSFTSTVPTESRDVVKSVVNSFLAKNRDYDFETTDQMVKNYEKYLVQLNERLEKKQAELITYAEKGQVEFPKPNLNAKTDEGEQGPQPAFQSLAVDQFKKMTDQLLQTEIDLMETESHLQVREEETQRNSDLPRERYDKQLKAQIAETFKRPGSCRADQPNEVHQRGTRSHEADCEERP
jgi:hypothetical protein